MYLKRLEIHGFKSFADKVVLDFRQGLSVVVGPNGSGKSNISDAIRWVIGEQSAKSLRGTKMEDVIFAGSAKRRPVGMAEVSLTLDNSSGIFPLDYNEVTVTRRVYRSGESEYLINKSACRLKDVHELFMDTGIGRDGFSIIGQGRVEEILSAKPEERRGLIEEVAGITKYRNRKREATRKLEETEQNLVRLADIISELEGQLEPLQQQSAVATQYLQFKTELDELELDLAVHDIDEINAKLVECREQIAALQDGVVKAETGVKVWEAENAESKLALQSLDERIYQAQSDYHSLTSRMQELDAEQKLCLERSGSVQEQQDRLKKEASEAELKQTALEAELKAEEAKQVILQHTRLELVKNLREQEKRLEDYLRQLGSSEDQIEKIKNEAFEVLSRTAKYNNELTAVSQQIQGRQHRQRAVENQAEIKLVELSNIKEKQAEGAKELDIVRNGVNALAFELNQAKEVQAKREEARKELRAEGVKLTERTQHVKSRLKVLQDMQRDFEGYNRGVKEVLSAAAKGRLSGICGVVAELIRVPAQLETAIEVALGGGLQNLVAENEADAKAAINFLKHNRFGRATFLPLDALQPGNRNFESKVLKAPGVLGVAADLVNCESKYRSVSEYLLGRILVVENLDQATQVARLGGYRLRIVTLEGEQLNPGGSMTGGSLQQRSTNLLSRNREIEQLAEESAGLQGKLRELQADENKLDLSIQESVQLQNAAQTRLKDMELNLAALDTRQLGLSQDEARVNGELAQLDLEQEQIAGELAVLQTSQVKLTQERDQTQEYYDQLSAQMAKAQDNLRGQGSAREQLQAVITELKVKIAALEQQEKGLQSVLEGLYRQRADLQSLETERGQQLRDLRQRQQSISWEIKKIKEQLAELLRREKEEKDCLERFRQERQVKFNTLEVKEEEVKDLRKKLQTQQEQLHAAQVKEARLEADISNAYTRLQENLALALEEARPRSKRVENRRDVASRINRLKLQINELGAVNLGAIEEFERIKERFSFLSEQQSDLLQAKESLFNVIGEMDRIMVERFDSSFNLIKDKFTQVFIELFGGGRAELQLTQPDNLLETGIEIIVQPPGKKLQHLSLLSGGEKALTAIALLFAMLKVKPSPFCVLDEIEAALDEANVNRFASYLQDLTSVNQFIVISHRKGTMEAADVLYGVTMEDNGVSKLYSVKMADAGEGMVS